MEPKCGNCGALSNETARFCVNCGHLLSSDGPQGRTVVAENPAPANRPLEIDANTVMQRAQTALGTRSISAAIWGQGRHGSEQRELVFLVNDVSYSMDWDYDGTTSKLEAAIRAAVNLTVTKARIDPSDEVGVVAFHDAGHLILPLSTLGSHKPRIIQEIQGLQSGSGTDIDAGLAVAYDAFQWHRQDVVRRILLLTDGQDFGGLLRLDELKRSGVIFDVIGVGKRPSDVNERLLRQVASTVEGELRYRFIKDHRTLVEHYTALAEKTATAVR